jgi:peptidoglycan-N-acetylglucosamine deacetylase
MNATSLSIRKRFLISAWLTWERLFHKWFSVIPVVPSNPLFFYRICAYRGKPIALPGDEAIASGDKVIELHFNNALLAQLGAGSESTVRLAAKLIHDTKEILPIFAERIEKDSEFQGVKGIYGITMIHRGTQRLGFTVIELPPGLFRSFTRLYLTFLLYVIHPAGKSRVKMSKEAFVPKLLAFSTKDLLNKYGLQRRIARVESTHHDFDS